MILILSEEIDQITNKVIDWIRYKRIEYNRINSEVSICSTEIYLSISDLIFTIQTCNNQSVNTKQINSFWYRRGNLMPQKVWIDNNVDSNIKKEIITSLIEEWKIMNLFLIKQFENVKHIGNYDLQIPNKLIVLQIAKNIGINVPETIVTTSLDNLIIFHKKKKSIITKPIFEVFKYSDYNQAYISRTELIDEKVESMLSNTFFPMLFQANIEKLFEIRVFFIHDIFYPMAIFVPDENNNRVDSRDNNNRLVPFKLPNSLNIKIKKLVKCLGLNTGSLDLIYSKKKKFVFLEVNPVGQFEFVSDNCNYFIEKEIVEYLSN
jgi:ATP-GRASP peptide maturase of grasp-with-spasm system